MKHFGVYRKLILIAGTVIAAVSVGSVFFMENTSALMLFVICAFGSCRFLGTFFFLIYQISSLLPHRLLP
jgi:hypothetical protein